VEIKSHNCINRSGRQDRQAPQVADIGVEVSSTRRRGILLISTTDRFYNKDQLDPQDQGIDSVLLAASIRQSGPSIRIAGISCIGIFFHTTLWISSRRFHRTGRLYVATEDLQGPPSSILSYPHKPKVQPALLDDRLTRLQAPSGSGAPIFTRCRYYRSKLQAPQLLQVGPSWSPGWRLELVVAISSTIENRYTILVSK